MTKGMPSKNENAFQRASQRFRVVEVTLSLIVGLGAGGIVILLFSVFG